MGKRGNDNAQLSKEDAEALNEQSSHVPTGKFMAASDDQLNSRRIVRVSGKWSAKKGTSASTNTPKPPSYSITNTTVPTDAPGTTSDATSPPQPRKNPFASISFASSSTSTPKSSFSFGSGGNTTISTQNTTTNTNKPFQTTNAATTTISNNVIDGNKAISVPFQNKKCLTERIPWDEATKLNFAMLRMAQMEKKVNPLSNWSCWVKQYLEKARVIETEFLKAKNTDSQANSSFNANGSAGNSNDTKIGDGDKLKTANLFSSFGKPNLPLPSKNNTDGGTSSSDAPKQFTGFSFGSLTQSGGVSSTSSTSASSPAASSSKPFSGFSFGSNTTVATAPAPTPASAAGDSNEDAFQKEDPAMVIHETNEEEDCTHECRAKYGRMSKDTKEWKMFSAGVLRLYRHKKTDACRMVLRNDIGKVQLNLAIQKGQKFVQTESKNKGYVQFMAVQDVDAGMERFMLVTRKSKELLDALESLAK